MVVDGNERTRDRWFDDSVALDSIGGILDSRKREMIVLGKNEVMYVASQPADINKNILLWGYCHGSRLAALVSALPISIKQ